MPRTKYYEGYDEYKTKSSILKKFKEFFKKKFNMYDFSAGYVRELYSDIWKNFRGCRRVIDAGCGRCEFLQNTPAGVESVGIDTSAYSVELCKSRGLKAFRCSCEKIPFHNNSFDGVYSSHVLEHLQEPEKAIKEFRRMLKEGGVVVIRTPDFSRSYRHFYDDYTHRSPFTKASMFRILYDNGFKDIEVSSGYYQNQIFFILDLFPKVRVGIERFLGRFLSQELMAKAVK